MWRSKQSQTRNECTSVRRINRHWDSPTAGLNHGLGNIYNQGVDNDDDDDDHYNVDGQTVVLNDVYIGDRNDDVDDDAMTCCNAKALSTTNLWAALTF